MRLESRIVVKETEFPEFMTRDYVEEILDRTPQIGPDDPKNPEWQETPVPSLNLGPHGCKFGGQDAIVHIKDESANPYGLLKARKHHELWPVQYRAFAENLWRQKLNGHTESIAMPRLTLITSGNDGIVAAKTSEQYNLPPVKLLLDVNTPRERIEELKKLNHADIYLAPLQVNIFTGNIEPYTPRQIRILTNNTPGHDVTSSRMVSPHRDFYDWHWHEIFNENPDEVYGSFGSGEWFANGLTWQRETAINGLEKKDVRLRTQPDQVTRVSILAAEPYHIMDSQADKLTGQKPFIYYGENDIKGMKTFNFTGKETEVCAVSEKYIKQAYDIMSQHFATEPSAAAGLALYLQRFEAGLIDPRRKILVVNTGRGI